MDSVPSIEKWSSPWRTGSLLQCKGGGVFRVDEAMAMLDVQLWWLPRSDGKKTVCCVLSMKRRTKMISRWDWTESVRKMTALRQYRSITLPNLRGGRKGIRWHV